MQSTTDVVIVGGGVIGCAIAYHLRKAGIDVVVLDQGDIGAEASSAAAGLLAPLGSLSGPGPFADLLLASFAAGNDVNAEPVDERLFLFVGTIGAREKFAENLFQNDECRASGN